MVLTLHHDEEKAGRCRRGIYYTSINSVTQRGRMTVESMRSKPLAIVFVAFACLLSMSLMGDMLSDTGATDFGVLYNEYSSPRMLSEEEQTATDDNNVEIDTANGPTFVFIMGIEGTGHHFINDLLAQSPNMKAMQELDMCNPTEGQRDNEFFKLASQFMSTSNGMFDPNKRNKNFLDVGKKYDTAVGMLKAIRDKVISWRQDQQSGQHQETDDSETGSEFHVAINANSCNTPTMMSYPSFIGPDRPLQNFNLDVFYNACADANVKCKHAYIYRNPHDVLKSTTRNRRYNSNMYDSIRLYTSVLQQMHSQLVSHPDRNLGCFGFLDANGYNIQQDWMRFWKLWGWQDNENTSFEEFMKMTKEINTKNPVVMEEPMKARLVPARLSVMMRAFEDIHTRVNDFCYSSLSDMDAQSMPIVNTEEVDSDEVNLDESPPNAIYPTQVEVA